MKCKGKSESVADPLTKVIFKQMNTIHKTIISVVSQHNIITVLVDSGFVIAIFSPTGIVADIPHLRREKPTFREDVFHREDTLADFYKK
jgi:hypothetical protein